MASANIHLHDDDGEPHGHVYTLGSGESFISVEMSGSLSVILAGRDQDAVDSARVMADALKEAADKLQARLDASISDEPKRKGEAA